MLFTVGTFDVIYGLTALFRDEYLAVTPESLILLDLTTWGLITLGLGALQIGAGIAILNGQAWGRVVGVIFATLSALTQLSLVEVQPVWSTLVVILDVLVIYALTAHGSEIKPRTSQ
jgi:hypothetical protein